MESPEATLERVELPADFAEAFQQISNSGDEPETLAECIDMFERMMEAAGVTVSVEQMYQPEPTRHAVHIGDSVEYVPCVLDALLAAYLAEADSVDIESESPEDEATVSLRVSDGTLEVRPSTAVFSMGLASDDTGESPPQALGETETAVSMASCSYINAFVDQAEYDRWERHLSDAVVMPLTAGEMYSLASVIATGWVFTGEP